MGRPTSDAGHRGVMTTTTAAQPQPQPQRHRSLPRARCRSTALKFRDAAEGAGVLRIDAERLRVAVQRLGFPPLVFKRRSQAAERIRPIWLQLDGQLEL